MIKNSEATVRAIPRAEERSTAARMPDVARGNGWGGSRILGTSFVATAMNMEQAKERAAHLYWLAFLLTGRCDVSIDIAANAAVPPDSHDPFFADWMGTWSRRVVIAKALAEIRDELAESARRTELARVDQSPAPSRDWAPSPDTTKAQIEEALLAIDAFPRAAVVLLIFESLRIADAVTLLDTDASLVRKGLVVGLRNFAASLARKKDRAVPGFEPARALAQTAH